MDYPIHFPNQLRQHLRALRLAKGLTQARLGQLLGLPQPRIAELEANPNAARVDLLLRVLAALDTQMLLRHKVSGPMPTEAAQGGATGPSQPGGSW
jgi:HTH-type transcriptional regulator / antitoxin HipB